jgi:guanine deaminase
MELEFLREAIRLSLEKMEQNEGGPFGAVIVKEGRVIGRGWNQVISAKDPTAHAELTAIRDACRQIGHFSLAGCEVYTSCEPCPMCLAAIYWARIDRVYYAASREDAAAAGFDDAMIYEELANPIAKRKLPISQALRDEALVAMQAWLRKENRVEY